MQNFPRIEMWCRRRVAAAILSLLLSAWFAGDSADALTTFGKSNTQSPKDLKPTSIPPRTCSREADCAGISSTSCVRTHYDPITRCLCGDNQAPVNGQCEAQSKLLYHICSNSGECYDGLICGTPNVTGTPPPHLRVLQPHSRICLCDTDSGYQEHEHTCNDADILKTSLFAIIVVSCIRKLITYE